MTIILSGENTELYSQLGKQYVKIPFTSVKEKRNEGYISSDEDEAAAEAWEPIKMQPNSFNDDYLGLGLFISAKRR